MTDEREEKIMSNEHEEKLKEILAEVYRTRDFSKYEALLRDYMKKYVAYNGDDDLLEIDLRMSSLDLQIKMILKDAREERMKEVVETMMMERKR